MPSADAASGSAGTSALAARADHVHPTDASRAASGANTDITSIGGLTTPLSVAQGGIGTGTAGGGALDSVLGLTNTAQAAAAVLVRTAAATWSFVATSVFAASARKILAGVGLAGGGDLTADRTLSLSRLVNPQTGTSYTIQASDAFEVVSLKNAAAVAVTIPQATTAGFSAGFGTTVINLGAGTVTVTPITSTINGAASLTLATGQSVDITSDGTNYLAAQGAGTASGGTAAYPVAGVSALSAAYTASASDKGKVFVLIPTVRIFDPSPIGGS